MEGQILVTPEQLESTANEFNSIMQQVQSLANNMTDQVTGLGSKWQGEASTAYINRFNQLNDDIAKLAGMINEHVTDLNEMASTYRSAEQANEELSNSLAGDIIV
jgi:WXG100 family type VII secretion target